MVSKLRKLATGAVATAALLLCQGAVAGLLTISILTGPGSPFNCPDQVFSGSPTGCDLNGSPNVVTVAPVVPGYTLASFTAFSNNPGSALFSILDITWTVNTLGATGGALEVLASQTDWANPTGTAILQSVIGGDVLNGSVTGQEWVNLANLLNGLGPVGPGPQGPFTAPFTNTALSAPYTSAAPFSVTDRLRFAMGPQGTSTGDLRSITPAPIPEPATLALLGAAMAGFGFSRRRKQR